MNGMPQANVLITGGLGFIGSHLARRLLGIGARVTIVDSLIPRFGGNLFNVIDIRDQIQVHICDVRDTHAMAHHLTDKDILFNLAGQTSHLDSMENPFEDLDINCHSQLSILESCRKFNPSIRVVFTSTRQLYGRPCYLPVDEDHPVRPVDVNGINKWAGEAYHLLYASVYGIESTVLRLTNTYGPAMRVKDARQTFLGIWIRRLFEDQAIDVYGDGMQRRDYNYVDDVVDALTMCAIDERAVGQVFNLGSRETYSLEETAALMVDVLGRGTSRLVAWPDDRKKIDIGDYYSDFSRIEQVLGWHPRVNLREGMLRTLSYYAENLGHYL